MQNLTKYLGKSINFSLKMKSLILYRLSNNTFQFYSFSQLKLNLRMCQETANFDLKVVLNELTFFKLFMKCVLFPCIKLEFLMFSHVFM